MSAAFNVRNPEIEQRLREIAARIGTSLEGTGVGFTLFLVETNNADGALFYISSVNRDDMVPAIKRWCDRQTQ